LGTLLFLSHSIATSVNAGKVAFTENPTAINYAQSKALLKRQIIFDNLWWTVQW